MDDLIKNTSELIEQGSEFLKQPAVSGLFIGIKNWIGNLLTRNKAAKEKLKDALKSKDELSELQKEFEFLEKWNSELQTELEAKEKEIDDFAKRAGLDLSGATVSKSIIGNRIGTMNGNMVAGDNNTVGGKQTDVQKIVRATKLLIKGNSAEDIAGLSGLPIELVTEIEQALK